MIVEGSKDQGHFEFGLSAKPRGPVTCLGRTFESDEARRKHFLGLLREGLEELHTKLRVWRSFTQSSVECHSPLLRMQ